MNLEGKVALVTGGASGLGRSIVECFSDHGAKVVIADVDDEKAQSLVVDLSNKGRDVLFVKTDITRKSDVINLINQAIVTYCRIDIVVNNAGIYPTKKFLDIKEEEWDRIFSLNVKSVYLVSQAALPHMIRNHYGKIVNIASTSVDEGPSEMTHYVSSKAAVIGLTRSLAREFAGHHINVNAVSPGMIVNPSFVSQRPAELIDMLVKKQAFQRTAGPEDIVGTILFLASPESDWVTGQTINVDGGIAMK